MVPIRLKEFSTCDEKGLIISKENSSCDDTDKPSSDDGLGVDQHDTAKVQQPNDQEDSVVLVADIDNMNKTVRTVHLDVHGAISLLRDHEGRNENYLGGHSVVEDQNKNPENINNRSGADFDEQKLGGNSLITDKNHIDILPTAIQSDFPGDFVSVSIPPLCHQQKLTHESETELDSLSSVGEQLNISGGSETERSIDQQSDIFEAKMGMDSQSDNLHMHSGYLKAESNWSSPAGAQLDCSDDFNTNWNTSSQAVDQLEICDDLQTELDSSCQAVGQQAISADLETALQSSFLADGVQQPEVISDLETELNTPSPVGHDEAIADGSSADRSWCQIM
jgi:hypothetical protein